MKRTLMVLSVLLLTAAMADIHFPTKVDCAGVDNPDVTFTYQAAIGADRALASYRGEGLVANDQGVMINSTFENDAISSLNTKMGELVTIKDVDLVADGGSMDISIVLPNVNFRENQKSVKIKTVLLQTRHWSSIAGPLAIDGALSDTRAHLVECEVSSAL